MMHIFSHTLRRTRTAAAVLLCAFPALALAADASIFISPITGTFNVGQQTAFVVRASSGGQASNGIDARLTYDPRIFSVDAVSVAGSVVNSWVQKPYVDEELGEITFIGGIGTSTILDGANLVTLLVTPVRSGRAYIRFDREAITINAADGTGGNILSVFTNGQYIIVPKDGAPLDSSDDMAGGVSGVSSGEVLGVATDTTSHVIGITSQTHPDQSTWYSLPSASLRFAFPDWVKYMKLGFDKNEHGRAEVGYASPIPQKTIENLEDGEWYAHASAYATSGVLYTGDYRIRVDRTLPTDFIVSEETRSDATDPNIAVRVAASDVPSGVDHYMFSLDGSDASPWKDDGTHVYHLRVKTSGTHELDVSVLDAAANTVSKKISFNVAPMAPPVVTLSASELNEDDRIPMTIEGTPSGTATIYIQRGEESPLLEQVALDREGKMEFETASRALPGTYRIWAVVIDERGATSAASSEQTFKVSPGFWGLLARHPVIPAGGLTLVVFAAFLRLWYRRLNAGGVEIVNEEPEHDLAYAFEEVDISEPADMHAPVVLSQSNRRQESVLPPPTRL